MASLSQDPQHALGRYPEECEMAGMMVTIDYSEAAVLDWRKVVCPLWMGRRVGVVLMSEVRLKCGINRLTVVMSAIMQ